MQQHTLRPRRGSTQRHHRRGQGNASRRGNFSARGCNGLGARVGGTHKLKWSFEGGQTPLIRRMPKLGGFRNPNRVAFQPVNLGDLANFSGAVVDVASLYAAKLVKKKNLPVKILGGGKFEKKLDFKVAAVSASAKTAIEKAGGSVEVFKKIKATETTPRKKKF